MILVTDTETLLILGTPRLTRMTLAVYFIEAESASTV